MTGEFFPKTKLPPAVMTAADTQSQPLTIQTSTSHKLYSFVSLKLFIFVQLLPVLSAFTQLFHLLLRTHRPTATSNGQETSQLNPHPLHLSFSPPKSVAIDAFHYCSLSACSSATQFYQIGTSNTRFAVVADFVAPCPIGDASGALVLTLSTK